MFDGVGVVVLVLLGWPIALLLRRCGGKVWQIIVKVRRSGEVSAAWIVPLALDVQRVLFNRPQEAAVHLM